MPTARKKAPSKRAPAKTAGRKSGVKRKGGAPKPHAVTDSASFGGIKASKQRKLEERLENAIGAFGRERFSDAARMARTILKDAPDAHPARELLGLCLYRQAKWGAALAELERFTETTGSTDQLPVMADCARAKKQYSKTKKYWDELRHAGAVPEVLAEGRMVMAGALVDQGKYKDAFSLLEGQAKSMRMPKEYHLRQWYVLADLFERMGELQRAHKLFERIYGFEPQFGDVKSRLKSLR